MEDIMSIEELEALRKKIMNHILLGVICSIMIALLVFIKTESPWSSSIIFIGFIFTMILNNRSIGKFSSAFKEIFVLTSLESVFTDLIYEPANGLDESVIKKTGMMHMGDRYSSNDYVSGKYKNVNVVQADVHIEEKHETTDSKGNIHTTWTTIFKGRWMIFDFNKYFKDNLQVVQKGFRNSKVSNWGSVIKYKRVMMDNQLFNNNFKIYAQDEHVAFYILTPVLMEKITNLTNNISGKLLFCFIDNQLHVGVQNNKDSFEHGIFTKIKKEEVMDDILQDIKLITDFVDELSLDNDLFRREV